MKMKTNRFLFIAITIFCMFSNMHAQQTVLTKELNMARPDDVTRVEIAEYAEYTENGADALWSLSEINFVGEQFETYYAQATEPEDSMHFIMSASANNYRTTELNGNVLYNVMADHFDKHVVYDVPEVLINFPAQYGSMMQGIFKGDGTYCDQLYIRQFGSYNTQVDGEGSLVLPDGDTLRHVLLLSTERTTWMLAKHLTDIYQGRDSFPVFNNDSIIAYMTAETPEMITKEKRWYAPGYRYPVFETIRHETAGGETIFQQAYYYSPHAQETDLTFDEENDVVRRAIAEGMYEQLFTDITGGGWRGQAGTLTSCSLIQNNESQNVTISYSVSENTKVRFVLADAMGIIYQTSENMSEAGVEHYVTISYAGLHQGQYVVYVSAGDETKVLKFNKLNM